MIDDTEKTTETDDARNEKIRQRAYELWLDEGQTHGRDQDYWFLAEREIAESEKRQNPSEPSIPNIEPD